jgi:hypothetical protein
MEFGSSESGKAIVARSKCWVVNSVELRLMVTVPGVAMREPSDEMEGAASVVESKA